MTFGPVDVGCSLPSGQAVKLIFFAPCGLASRIENKKDDFSAKDYVRRVFRPHKVSGKGLLKSARLTCRKFTP